MIDQRNPIPDPSGEEHIRAIVEALNGIGIAINRLAEAYLYVNQQDDEPSFEGQSLSDREHL